MQASEARIWIAIPNTGTIAAATVAAAEKMAKASCHTSEIRYLTAFPVEVCRQRLVDAFLANPARTHLFFLDSDMVPPVDTLDRLLALDRPIACLPCPMFAPSSTPMVTSNVWKVVSAPWTPIADRIVRYLEPDEFPPSPFECDGTGLACCLIRRDVFEAMGRPMFSVVRDAAGSQVRVGEDATFFNRAAELGFRITVDPARWCDHLKEVDLTHLEDFFADEPLRWTWTAGPTVADSTFVAVVTDSETIHSSTAGFLARQREDRHREGEIFRAADCSNAVQSAIRTFLRQRKERTLFLVEGSTSPPADFVERCSALESTACGGVVREMSGEQPVYAVARRDLHGQWKRLEDVERTGPVDGAVGLYSVLLDRSLLQSIGTAWLRPGTSPFRAGIDLALAARQNTFAWPTIVPIGCPRYATIGLASILSAKQHIRQELRAQGN